MIAARSRSTVSREFANMQVAYDPGRWLALIATVAAHGRDLPLAAGTPTPTMGACNGRCRRTYPRRGGRAGPD